MVELLLHIFRGRKQELGRGGAFPGAGDWLIRACHIGGSQEIHCHAKVIFMFAKLLSPQRTLAATIVVGSLKNLEGLMGRSMLQLAS
jgi:hypothetical protein